MAVDAVFDTRELEQLAKDLELIADHYPDEAKTFLQQQANETRKRMRQMYNLTTEKKTGNLLKGIRRTQVQKYQEDYQIRVKNTAPHAHLIEHGHVQWVPVKGDRKRRRKTEQFVEGRHPAAFTVRSMKATMGDDASKMVDKVLKKGGLG